MKFHYVTISEYEPTRTLISRDTQTLPDLSYTVGQLFERMCNGMPLPDNVIPTYYDDDEDIDNPDPTQRPGFDLADYTEEMLKLQRESELREVQSNQKSEAVKDADATNATTERTEE